jgi:dienelactone hydrolase
MTLYRILTLAATLLATPALADQALAEPPLLRSQFEMATTIDRAPARLEAMEIRPRGPGPFPLAVIAHGKDSGDERRRAQSALGMTAQATAFARRGFIAVVAMRRGYGTSQGTYAENDGTCEATRYLEASRGGARDLTAIVAAAAARPGVDRNRILVVGESVGGVTALALATMPPPGVVGIVNFAGGRGGNPAVPGDVCQKDKLVDTIRAFGAQGKLPTLWVYAENDKVFAPDLARAMHQAFTGAGGKASLAMLPPVDQDGHRVFSRGSAQWDAPVDAFLKGLGLPTLPATAPPPMPERLGANGQAAFRLYAASPLPFKAFANSGQGNFGWAASANSIGEARKVALENCTKPGRPCTIVAEESWIAAP